MHCNGKKPHALHALMEFVVLLQMDIHLSVTQTNVNSNFTFVGGMNAGNLAL